MAHRTAFFISDGTGITAETFASALLAQFETKPHRVRLPFVDSADKAHQAVHQINHCLKVDGNRPLVFTTVVNKEVLAVLRSECKGMLIDMFGTFIAPLEAELGIKSNHRVGRFSDVTRSQEYHDRIEAINFTLAHDDGQTHVDLANSDVILIGVSRSGKTPTSLYLAMQFGLKVSNYPLIPEDFERRQLPPALVPFKKKLFGLTIQPRAPERDPQQAPPGFALRQPGQLPLRGQRGQGHDAPLGRALAVHHQQVDRGDLDHHPAGDPARPAGLGLNASDAPRAWAVCKAGARQGVLNGRHAQCVQFFRLAV